MASVAALGNWSFEIVKRTLAHHFTVLPRRWVVGRTFASISRNRRLARDFQRYAGKLVAAFRRLATIRLMCSGTSSAQLVHRDSELLGLALRHRRTFAPETSPRLSYLMAAIERRVAS